MTNKKLLELYFNLCLPRRIEEKMLLLLRQGKISKWFSGIGQEAISVGATMALNEEDVIFPMHRNLGVFTSRKVDLTKLFCQLMGKSGGFTKGRDRSFHFGLPEKNIIGMISHLAAMLPVADGFGLAFKLRKEKRIALSFTGDGANSGGDFHEALNLAAVWNLPIIFLIENNGYGLSTPIYEQFKCKKLSDKAIGYGIMGMTIDGNNVLEVYDSVTKAANKARSGQGPTVIEALTFRMRGHEEASGTKYIPDSLMNKWTKKDPILQFEKYLKSKKLLTKKNKTEIDLKIIDMIMPAFESALNAPEPTSTIDNELNDVYHPVKIKSTSVGKKSSKLRFVDTISSTLLEKMTTDESIILMGQDIAEYGGVFKITEGFFDKFGSNRVRNTPIIESGVIGTAMGLALSGFKPIVEIQFSDFISCGFNQVVNNLAKTYYRWGSPLNVTIRMPTGGNVNAGPFHSQSTEAWFCHVPGLKIVYPATPHDAKGLLNSAIDDPNPVLYFEHKAMYRAISGDVPDNHFTIEIGKGEIKKQGKDLTVVTYGYGVHWALEKSREFLENGIEFEIIDLRSLLPWDKELVAKSVKKTNRVLIIHEATLTGGIGAEISAYITENLFEFLDAPVCRVCALDTPVPFSKNLENDIFLPINRITEKLNWIMDY